MRGHYAHQRRDDHARYANESFSSSAKHKVIDKKEKKEKIGKKGKAEEARMQDTIFSPSFGNRPTQLVGRSGIMKALLSGLETRPGSRERAVVLLGQRGSGKTVLLWELADEAARMGYVVATPTITSDGMLERVIEKVQDAGEEHVKGSKRHLSGGSIGALGFTAGLQFTEAVQETKSPQYRLVQLARKLSEYKKGMLILIDELQANSNEIRQLVIAYQEMVGEGLNVALVMAGLPGAVSATLNDKVLTFLNRASKENLGPLPESDVNAYFATSFKTLGLDISPEAREQAAKAVKGSPYLLQLIGHNIVSFADESGAIAGESLEEALRVAQRDYENDICRTSLASLSDVDVQFLQVLSDLGSPAKIKSIAAGMGKTTDYVQKYRTRLLESGIIEVPRRGEVSIAVPYLEEHLKNTRES